MRLCAHAPRAVRAAPTLSAPMRPCCPRCPSAQLAHAPTLPVPTRPCGHAVRLPRAQRIADLEQAVGVIARRVGIFIFPRNELAPWLQ